MRAGAEVAEKETVVGQGGDTVEINPLSYPGWEALLAARPDVSFFHGSAWARVLHETYGHEPVYFCRFDGERLAGLFPVMEVSSLWTGPRGVSLPFSDVCPPVGSGTDQGAALYDAAMSRGRLRGWRYLECRGHLPGGREATPSLSFYGHTLDLDSKPDAAFQRFDGAVRRGIRKAEKSGLSIEFGDDLAAIRTFYALHCLTRRYHGLPPQPFRFFANIARHILGDGRGFVAIASVGARPVAAAVFFQGGRQAIYKFGAFDRAFQHLRPNNQLMWEAIKRLSANGFTSLHLGRTSLGNPGLRRFKLGFGAREEVMSYYRFDFAAQRYTTQADRAQGGWASGILRRLPLVWLRLAGWVLYPHLS